MSLCSLSSLLNLSIGVYSIQDSIAFIDPQVASTYCGGFYSDFLAARNDK